MEQSNSRGLGEEAERPMSSDLNRRQFLMGSSALAGGALFTGCANNTGSFAPRSGQGGVSIYYDASKEVVSAKPTQWGIQHLRQSLEQRSIPVRVCTRSEEINPADLCVAVEKPSYYPVPSALGPMVETMPELVQFSAAGHRLSVGGNEPVGLTYGLSELADIV